MLMKSDLYNENNVIAKTGPLIGEGQGFDRVRRITGYLVGTLDRFNDAKRAEERDRVRHYGMNDRSCRDIGIVDSGAALAD